MTAAPQLLDSEPGFATVCAMCRRECKDWYESVNITADTFFLCEISAEFDVPVVELDAAFDWCSIECFARWVFVAAAYMQSPQRPPE